MPSVVTRYTERRRILAAAGICGRCGKRPLTGTRKTCLHCCRQVKARYVALVRAGKCVLCRKAKATPGKRWCATCRAGQLAYLRVYAATKRAHRAA